MPVKQVFFLLILILFSGWSEAQTGPGVYDRANLLSEPEEAQLNNLIQQLENLTTAEVAVLTTSSLEQQTIESYANKVFNLWGIGKREFNNGVLFVIAPQEHRARIEVGYGLEELLTDSWCGATLDSYAIPYFKTNNYPQGIIQTTAAIVDYLKSNSEMAKGISNSTPWYLVSPRKNSQYLTYLFSVIAICFLIYGIFFSKKSYSPVVFLGFILLLVALIIGIYYYTSLVNGKLQLGSQMKALFLGLFATGFNIKRFLRYAPKRCKFCSTTMVKLTEELDDQQLSASQIAEEKLKSVDYDVWHCAACLHNEVTGYKTFFSRAQKCPQCQAITGLHSKTTVLVSATVSHSGKTLEEFICQSCKFVFTKEQITPRISTSSGSSSSHSSSSGSFGGGSSGGGGASRGW